MIVVLFNHIDFWIAGDPEAGRMTKARKRR